jgi:class 3 adenylate cyclase
MFVGRPLLAKASRRVKSSRPHDPGPTKRSDEPSLARPIAASRFFRCFLPDPKAQENDAERAVRAALAIQRALAELNIRNARSGAPELMARIGLESGPVVVDATGEVFGEAPNIAARVQSAPEPGTVLVTASVLHQTAGLFVAEPRGAQELKGVTHPIVLYRILRASRGGRRGGARVLTPLVGREDELSLLQHRWARARGGEG